MQENKLNFGILIRIFISLLPILFGMPTIATITCAYNIAMTFITAGPLATTVSSLCAVAAAMFLSSSYGVGGEVTGLVLGIQAVFCAAGCITGLFKRKDFYNGLTLATAGVLLPQLIYLNSTAHKNGISLADMIAPSKEEMRALLDQTITIPKDFENVFAIGAETLDKISELMRNLTVMIIPAALIISSMITAYIVMWAVAAPLRKVPNKKIHSFSKIKLPRGFVVLAIILVAVLLYTIGTDVTPLTAVALNMILVIFAIALFSGISLADYYLRKTVPFNFIRIIVHAFVTLNFFPIYILAALVDSFANFRKLPKITERD